MVVILKPDIKKTQMDIFMNWVNDMGLESNVIYGEKLTVVGLVGDTSTIDLNLVRSISIVQDVRRIQQPYKNANRMMHPEDTVIEAGGVKIGEGGFCVMSGPCSVESEEQIVEIARRVKAAGANILRGGAFKPRTSPYAFQGLREDGIKLLLKAKEATGMPIVTEIMSAEHLPLFEDVDIIQVGARNMQNYELLKELGHAGKPILLKRGLANSLEELLMSAEYILRYGNKNVILCERGIRTFETATRNTLDIAAVPFLKQHSHLPVIVDPSHASGMAWMVPSLSRAALAVGADGIIVEVHNNPERALSDGEQSLRPDEFDELAAQLQGLSEVMGKHWGGVA